MFSAVKFIIMMAFLRIKSTKLKASLPTSRSRIRNFNNGIQNYNISCGILQVV